MSGLDKLNRALNPGARPIATEARLKREASARAKREADYKNGNLTDAQRWALLSELGMDPRRATPQDHINAERRTKRARIPGYDVE